jgi:ABC-type phosphate transport system substrate-binding protein
VFHVLRRNLTPVIGRGGTALAIVVCLLIVPASGADGSQGQADIAVIVHPGVGTDNLSIPDLRRMLTGDREFWPGGVRVTIFIRAPIARERDAVVRDLCQMTEAQFRQHWIGKVFRADAASGPKIVYSSESTIEQVSRTPGAIGFVQGTITSKGVKVLRIDGRAPGQSGYRLR